MRGKQRRPTRTPQCSLPECDNVPATHADKNILGSDKKKEQKRLLLNASLSTQELISFVFYAWGQRFSYSQYIGKRHHKGVMKEDLPMIIRAEGGEDVVKVGAQ